MPPKRRGGWRQRLAAPDPELGGVGSAGQGHSQLLDRILQMWSWGFLSAPTVQHIVEGAVLDGLNHPAIVALSKIGSSGRHPQNCHRDICRNFMADVKIPEPHVLEVPAVDIRKPEEPATGECPVLLPHELFAQIATDYQKLWAKATDDGNLEAFWEKALATGDPHLSNHPMTRINDWQQKFVPLIIYGDGAAFARKDSLEVAAWSFLLAKAGTWSSKFVMACWVKSAEADATWATAWAKIMWSFACLFEGVHPLTDSRGAPWPVGSKAAALAGQPLTAQGHRGVVHRVTGDLDWYFKRLGLRLAPSANLPCCWCEGGRPGHGPPFLHLDPAAAWLASIPRPPRPPPNAFPVWQLGINIFGVAQDDMHVLDLGVLAHFAGSVFHTLVYEGSLPGSPDARTDLLWVRLRELYSVNQTNCRISRLQRNLWCDPTRPHATFPVMKTKAAETRQMMPAIVQLCFEHNSGSPRDVARLQAAVQISRLLEVFATAGHFLTDAQHAMAMQALWAFCKAYTQLAMDASQRQRLQFNMVNKFHCLVHLVLNSKFLNPTTVWTYPFEDLMGRMKRVAMASKSGLVPHCMPRTILLKYRKVLHFALEPMQ